MSKRQIKRLEQIIEREMKKENPNEEVIGMAKVAINKNKERIKNWELRIKEKIKNEKKYINISEETGLEQKIEEEMKKEKPNKAFVKMAKRAINRNK
ncbi:hypothetical protein ACFJ93_004281 [Vibrio parahaemolyticus]|nr:hypothetical protein [Vibrio parahaemolyticus]